jgi:hypothetical protein
VWSSNSQSVDTTVSAPDSMKALTEPALRVLDLHLISMRTLHCISTLSMCASCLTACRGGLSRCTGFDSYGWQPPEPSPRFIRASMEAAWARRSSPVDEGRLQHRYNSVRQGPGAAEPPKRVMAQAQGERPGGGIASVAEISLRTQQGPLRIRILKHV